MRKELVDIYDEIIRKINSDDEFDDKSATLKEKRENYLTYVEFSSPIMQVDRKDSQLKVKLKRHGNLQEQISVL